jgi:hypothetical protein
MDEVHIAQFAALLRTPSKRAWLENSDGQLGFASCQHVASLEMLRIFFIFETNIFEQVCVRQDSLVQFGRPRFRVRLRVVHSNVNFQASKIRPPEALGERSGIRKRAAISIKPVSVPESARPYD